MKSQTNRLAILCLTALSALHVSGKGVTISVYNDTDLQRQQLVEIDNTALHKSMGIDSNSPVRVKNALGQEVAVQQTYNGKLLFEVAVRPGSVTKFLVSEGVPSKMKPYAGGAFYPNRLDDIAWENDRCAYRVYGPALQRRGEKSYGVDVWSKSTPDMVVAQRYKDNNYGNELREAYRLQGFQDVHDSIFLATSFHLDHGNGLDAYAVGPSLGCGAPALMYAGQLVLPYCYKEYKILDNGPLRFTVQLTFPPVGIGNSKQIVAHRIISLDKGSNFNRCEVWYDGLDKEMLLAAGVVVHKADTVSLVLGGDKVVYADPTDRPGKLGTQVYVGVLFPEGCKESRLVVDDGSVDIVGNAVGIVDYRPGAHFVYYFGSAWSGYDVRSFAEWQLRSDSSLKALRSPLKVVVEE